MDIVNSKNGVPIRLTDERWEYIATGHGEMARKRNQVLTAVQNPDKIVEGTHDGEFLAAKQQRNGNWVVVVYKELTNSDGFVITAWVAMNDNALKKKNQIWP